MEVEALHRRAADRLRDSRPRSDAREVGARIVDAQALLQIEIAEAREAADAHGIRAEQVGGHPDLGAPDLAVGAGDQ